MSRLDKYKYDAPEPRKTKFYRDKQNGKFMGVCAGIADYTGVDVLWIRISAVLLTLMGGFPWTLFAYWGIGLPVGYALGLTDWFGPANGPSGLWQGLIVGLTCAALMLGVRLARSAKRHIRRSK